MAGKANGCACTCAMKPDMRPKARHVVRDLRPALPIPRLFFLLTAFAVLPVLTACVTPGDAAGALAVGGQLLAADGTPVSGMSLEVVLPRAYGLRDSLVSAENKVDFSRPKRSVQVVTDENGWFTADLGRQPYYANQWNFPPRGMVPASPPSPTLLIRASHGSDACFYIQDSEGRTHAFDGNGSPVTAGQACFRIAGFKLLPAQSEREPRPTPLELAGTAR